MTVTPYNRFANFQSFQAANPTSPPNGASLDAELNRIKATTDSLAATLAQIQNSNGTLGNGTVGTPQLNSSITVGFSPPTIWATSKAYVVPQSVFINSKFYVCALPHTSGVFAADLAAGNWILAADLSASLIAGALLNSNNLSDILSAATARGNIAAAASGANSDITSLAATGNVAAGSLTLAFGAPFVGGRLTLTSSTPIMTGAVAAATTVYFTPYLGQLVPLWNGVDFVWTAVAERSNVLANSAVGNAGPSAAAASQVYDLYEWNNAGTVPLTRSPAWSVGGGSNTARGTGAGSAAQTRVNGVLVNAFAITNGPGAGAGTYVGTIATDSGGGTVSWSIGSSASGGSPATLNVWNMFNRVMVAASVIDNGANYTYTSATIRQARGSAGNQVGFVMGQREDGIYISYCARMQLAAAINGNAQWGVGLDSTSTYVADANIVSTNTAATLFAGSTYACSLSPALGAHVVSANESSDGSSVSTFNLNSLNALSALLRM